MDKENNIKEGGMKKVKRVFVVEVEVEENSDMSARAIEGIIEQALVNPDTRESLVVREAK